DPCQNGGHWMGVGCICPPNVEGERCQFRAPTINITAGKGEREPPPHPPCPVPERDTPWDIPISRASVLVLCGKVLMDQIYRNVSSYRGTQVLSLTKGSVVVNYKVLLHPPAGDKPTTSLDHQVQKLLEAANTAAHGQSCSHSTKGLCFSTSSSRTAHTNVSVLNATELCKKYTPANFSRYYYPYRMQNSLLCISNCTLNVPGSINCESG
ncbi:MUC3B protein, partial [Haliaeetus albicilla]|nr:MUC3B protein [Haliaeetus albicilla]